MQLKLYHYWRSSSSWRVRWALCLKGLSCELIHIDLVKGEQQSKEFLKKNPLGLVPVLRIAGGGSPRFLGESTAIIEWLEETCPTTALLPKDPFDRAVVRQLAQMINAGTQPLQNFKTQKVFSQFSDKKEAWTRHWIQNGLTAYEALAAKTAGRYSFGDRITMADLFLVPQVYNAIRFGVALTAYPTIVGINENCLKTEACQASHPDRYRT